MKSKGRISNLPALVLTLYFALFVGFSIFCLPNETYSAVTALDPWTNIYTGAPNNNSGTIDAGSLTVSTAGTNRLFLAAVCLELSNSWYLYTLNVTLGGTALTTIGNTGDNYNYKMEHCYMGYLKESLIPAASSTLSVQYSSYYNITGIHVKWASYSDVNQTIPINDSKANTNAAANVTFGDQIDYVANGLTLYVTANGGASATMTAPSGFSQSNIEQSSAHSSFIANTANHASNGNYASGTTVTFSGTDAKSAIVVAAINPLLATIVGNGTNPVNVTICPAPNGVATELDAFTLQTSVGTDTVTGVTVTLSSILNNAYDALSFVDVTDDSGTTVYGSVSNPSSNIVSIPVTGMPPVTTDDPPAQYKVRITPKPNPDMPAGTYYITGTVTGITSTNPKIGSDSNSATITIDNSSPWNPTGLSGIPGEQKVTLTWPTPSGSTGVVILRKIGASITDTPVEGVQYNVNETIGSSTVIYAGSDTTTTDTGLTNGQNYYYKIFARDDCYNYSTAGYEAGPYTPGPVVTVSSSGTQVTAMNAGSTAQYIGAAFTFQQSSGTADTITALTITDTGNVIANTQLTNVKVYYESGVDLANCVYNGTETSINTSFNASDKIVLTSISIPVGISPNYTCVYVVFDVDPSAVNNTAVDLEIKSSTDFTLSGGTMKYGLVSYPIALAGSTTIRSPITTPVKVGSFQSGTVSGDVTVSGIGFQPRAVIFFWTRQDSTGFSTKEIIGMGFAAEDLPDPVNRGVAGACDDDATTTNCGRRKSETYSIIFLSNGNPALSGQGKVKSFNSDGFIINWASAPGINAYINYMAIGGDDNMDVKAGTITATNSAGNQSFIGIGFQPDFVMFLAGRTGDLDTNAGNMLLNTGFMTPTGQAAVSVCGRDNCDGTTTCTNTVYARSQQSTDMATMGMIGDCTQDWLARYGSMDSDGFTLNFSSPPGDPPAGDTLIFYLALKGGTHKVGAVTQPTSGTPPFTVDYTGVTGTGFQPVGLFMASFNRTASTSIAAQGEISIGAASSSTERGTIWGETRNIIKSDANMSIQTDKVIRLATGIDPSTGGTGTPTIDAEADFSDFLSDGFRLNWTTRNDATARQIVYWAIGNNVTIIGDDQYYFANKTIGPGAGREILDAFTLKTSTGTDEVTGVTVTLSPGSFGGLSLVEITDNNDTDPTVYGSVSNPASETVLITLDENITVTTTEIKYRVRITPKSHADMPAPPGSKYFVTGKVSAITSTNTKINKDENSYWLWVEIDNLSPSDPDPFDGSPGEGQVYLYWINPYTDFSEVVLLRKTSDFIITEIPVEGIQYYQGNTIGDSTVRYVGTGTWDGEYYTFNDTGLTAGETYYYKIFAKDSRGNYSVGGTPSLTYPSVTASSSDPDTQVPTMEAGSPNNYIGAAFRFQQSSGTNTITDLTISETGDADADTELTNVKVYYETNVASCAANPAGTPINTFFDAYDKIVLSSISIPVSIKPNFTCIYVVFDVDLLAVDGHLVDLQITSSYDFTLSGSVIKSGVPVVLLGSTTLQDTTPPVDISSLTVMPGNNKITFNWMNPSDSDFKGVRISRATGATAPSNCSSGTDVASPATSYTDYTVVNSTTYSYRLCSYDEVPNYSPGVTASETPPQIPILNCPLTPYEDCKEPNTGDTTTDFTFKVIYTDWENDAPASGYPKIHIGDDDGIDDEMFSYIMTAEDPGDTNYTDGKTYYFTTGLGAAQNLKFYFEAKAASGKFTDVAVQLPETGYSTGPSVYLMIYNNMVGVPKDLGTGRPYSEVLLGDSGAKYCIFWDSTGLDIGDSFSGSWKYCINGNIEKGKGYYIWSMAANTYRLDEPIGVGNVTDANVDIALDTNGGWTMISNPYNVNIELQDVKVMREGDVTEYTFSQAVNVPNEWIDNSIYEYEGPITGYSFKAFNGSPPAILEPWVGYFIYVKDITTPTTLRVYKPVP